MPFSEIKAQVEKALGKPLLSIFKSFDETPFAAASIGQVHKAVLPDGRQVVVKVQYPGVDEACESDLKQVRLALRLMGVLRVDRKLQERLFKEIQESLDNELNYQVEAQNLEVARAFHEKLDSKIVIPKVFPEYSSRHVLTLSFEQGESIETASAWPLEVRNALGRRLFRAMGQEIFYLKRFHCDPHPGNFAFREDGTVIIYDFGGVKTLSSEIVHHFKQLIHASRERNVAEIEDQLDALHALAEKLDRKIMVRLVKGAYWDTEIKRAQALGLPGYPVFTRKASTDVSYLACARKLLAVPESIYPQFATHNAHSLSAIYQLAGQNYYPGQYEFQCLHGMGEPLYEQVVGKVADGKLGRPCRIYAPVGSHETLLAYLVRRLLENGANTSFVNRIADNNISLSDLVQDPVQQIEQMAAREGALGLPHPRIPLPRDLYGEARPNSAGLDLANEHRLGSLSAALLASTNTAYQAVPMLGCDTEAPTQFQPVLNPADHRDVVGQVSEATVALVDKALACSLTSGQIWQSTPPAERAAVLDRAADLMESELQPLMGLLVRESGKTFANAIAEVREAVDFLRYYAAQARNHFANESHRPLGPVVCISPWNFPLAIFSGQVCAALAAGNTVLAKPAEQTPLIAAQAVRILLEAGVPAGAVQLLPGRGETVGAALIADERVRGVMFTGSTEVAGIISRNLAGRLDAQGRTIPLIAETGGQNAMIVDSSALTEQVVMDVISSAFDSAGQRCSALRVLCVQDDVADRVIRMLKGAMAEYKVGSPEHLSTDIGPVIDAEAKANIERHIKAMGDKGRRVHQIARTQEGACNRGTFVLPTLIELDSLDELGREVFGPVLHLVRYPRARLGELLEQINGSGYGLTLGVHTRIDETIAQVVNVAKVGNLYVNRNIVGAVVGVQPFGGEGLSGTGPKAGGPLYMYRLLGARPQEAVTSQLRQEQGATPQAEAAKPALLALRGWAGKQAPALVALCDRYGELALSGLTQLLVGPTGERNSYSLLPRERVLCLAQEKADLLAQLAACLAVGSQVLLPDDAQTRSLLSSLPTEVRDPIALVADWATGETDFDALLHHGDSDQLREVSKLAAARQAARNGAIIGVHGLHRGETDIPLERLLIEHALSVNTAAAGGNASLMTIG